MNIDPKIENSFRNEDDRVLVFDDFAGEVIHSKYWSYSEFPETRDKFLEQFDVVGSELFGDPDEDFYQGIKFITVIKRKSDGRMFGYEHWEPVAKHADPELEPNGEEHGFDWDIPDNFNWDDDYFPNVYVFLPVEPFTITGYQIKEK